MRRNISDWCLYYFGSPGSRSATQKRAGICSGLFILALVSLGCQKQRTWHLVSIEGKVVCAGRPLIGVEIVFWPDMEAGTHGPRASGFTNHDGHYELQTDSGDRGVSAGKYRVCIVNPRLSAVSEERDRKLRFASRRIQDKRRSGKVISAKSDVLSIGDEVLLPRECGEFSRTPLRATIHADDTQVVDFIIP